MIENTVTGKHCRSTFGSLTEFAQYAETFAGQYGTAVWSDYMSDWFFGTDDPRSEYQEAFKMAAEGWNFYLERSLALTDKVIDEIKDETTKDWVPTWDVSGSVVDMGMYVTGEPECMIDFPPTEISKVGRVVTLCVSLSVSAMMDADMMVRRGVVINALTEILAQRGLGTEVWADISYQGSAGYSHSQRILLKGTNDTIDHSRILYALANPSMFRVLSFAAAFGLPGMWRKTCSVGSTYGMVGRTIQDLEDGTLYLGTRSGSFDMESDLRAHLRTLGLLDES